MLIAAILVILALGALLSYSRGVKKQKPWGVPALAVCTVGLYLTLVVIAYQVVVVMLLAVVLAAYVKGVRQQRAWGKPAVVLCTGAILLALAIHYLTPRRTLPPQVPVDTASAGDAAKLIGQGLRPLLREQARVLIFYPPGQPALEEMKRQWRRGLGEGMGGCELEIIGYAPPDVRAVPAGLPPPPPGDFYAAAFNKVLEATPGKLDAIVSFVGVPADVSEIRGIKGNDRVVLGAFFPAGANVMFAHALKGGYVQAAVVKGKDGMELYTPDKLPSWLPRGDEANSSAQ